MISIKSGNYDDQGIFFGNKYIYLCDGEDGLKLFNELLQGKNLESKDIIW